ncbi:hypothetical protein U8V72_14815 [Priestia filamentosa]|uniref:hypothetical protein n=1 Tax=Priestia filamentosa TaxID=1402861 RepID=UPI000588FC52
MQTKLFNSGKGINLGMIILFMVYWISDAVLMWFMKPSSLYFLIEIVVMVIMAFVLFSFKKELMNKDIKFIYGLLLFISSMGFNILLDLIHTNWL